MHEKILKIKLIQEELISTISSSIVFEYFYFRKFKK